MEREFFLSSYNNKSTDACEKLETGLFWIYSLLEKDFIKLWLPLTNQWMCGRTSWKQGFFGHIKKGFYGVMVTKQWMCGRTLKHFF